MTSFKIRVSRGDRVLFHNYCLFIFLFEAISDGRYLILHELRYCMEAMKMKITFYGTRGSIPTPGEGTVQYGGDTSCLTVETSDGLYIFDMGSGARVLGSELIRGKTDADVFISHTHWDHINGFPFFKPCYKPGNVLRVYGGHRRIALGRTWDKTEPCTNKCNEVNYTKSGFLYQQGRDFFPVALDKMGANITFTDLNEEPIINGFTSVQPFFHSCHPEGMFGYLIQNDGTRVAYTGDYEHDGECLGSFGPKDRTLIGIINGVDALVMDGQYDPEEYMTKKGWGHSNILRVCDIAAEANVGSLYITHHDPESHDIKLDGLEQLCQGYMSEVLCKDIPVKFAKQGMKEEILSRMVVAV
ncbi:MBL fold metallo-hydrolase [Candidatus Woesearchaeota archaeon]|nr:MBL fold metallo-hydrolase [Candidatus Woesearchaeota archaeon]